MQKHRNNDLRFSSNDKERNLPYKNKSTVGCKLILIFVLANFIWHAFLILISSRIGNPWMVIKDWFFVAACYIPPIATAFGVMGIVVLGECKLLYAVFAIVISVVLACLHKVVIDLAIAII